MPATSVSFGGPANSADPYIEAEAQALNNDPNQIFAFVRDQIAFEAYVGSLRGARGTLWSKAGNSLDKASLLIALLGAAGVSAQYVEGTLSSALQQQLILSMFAAPYNVAGCPPATALRANPATDPTLLATVANHYWVEIGPGNTPADPNFPSASIGQTFGAPVSEFATVPASLQSTVTFRLDVETYSAASSFFGLASPLSTQEVLNETISSADLVGRPVTYGHQVTSTTEGFVITATTNTYTPYLRVSVDAANPQQDQLLSGTAYQDVLTDFPLGTQVVTGIFMYMDETDSQGNVQTFERTLFDRIGYAARQSGATITVSASASTSPAIGPFDLYTVNALPNLQDPSTLSEYQTAYTSARSTLASLQPALNNINQASPSASDQVTIESAQVAVTDMLVATGRYETAGFMTASDTATSQSSSTYYVKAYFNQPRLIGLLSLVPSGNSVAQSSVSLALDLRADDVFVAAPPMQVGNAPFYYRVRRGFDENGVETAQMAALAQQSGNAAVLPSSTALIFQAAQTQGIPLVTLSSDNASELNGLQISADAMARISNALAGGQAVMVPASSPLINGVPTIGWYETDGTTGYTVGVLEDGGNQAITEYPFLLGIVTGAIVAILAVAGFFFPNYLPPPVAGAGGAAIGVGVAAYIAGGTLVAPALFLTGALLGLLLVLALACLIAAGVSYYGSNSNYGNFARTPGSLRQAGLSASPRTAEAPANLPDVALPMVLNLGAGDFSSTPLTVTPGVSQVVPTDSAFLPLAFGTTITNTEGQTDAFSFTENPPAGFSVESSLPSLTIPAGQTGHMEVCLVPTSQLPAPGASESLGVTATATSTNATASASFSMPAVQGVALSASPSNISTTPGQGASSTLQIQSTGNVSAEVTLTSSAPSNLTVSGLTSPISLAPGATTTQTITLTPGSGSPLGTELQATITGTVTNSSSTQPDEVMISVTPQAAQALSATQAAQSAGALGRPDIATTLSGLSGAINTALSSCSAASQAAVAAYVNNLIQEMNAPYLQNFVSQLQSAATAISSASCSTLPAALTQLSNILSSLNTVLSSPAAYPFNLSLLPNSSVAQPNQTSQFQVFLQNNSTTTNTYTLSLGALPSGASGSLSQMSVMLAPGASTSSNFPLVSITPTTAQSFQFAVSASINGLSGSTQTAYATMNARSTFLAVNDVTATPGFTNAGVPVDVTTHIANVVNQNMSVQVSLSVINSSNTTVIGPVNQTVTLSVASLLTTVDFGQINTTGLADGTYTLAVSVINPSTNQAIPGGTGSGTLLIGSPVTATLTGTPATLAPGNGVVTSTLNVATTSAGPSSDTLTLLGSVAVSGGGNAVAATGNTAYLCGQNSISVVDVTTPASPNVLSSFGASDLAGNGGTCQLFGANDLVELTATGGSSHNLVTYNIGTPTSPSKIGGPSAVTPGDSIQPFIVAMAFNGATAYFTTAWFNYYIDGNDIYQQAGDTFDYDLSNPASPAFLSAIQPTDSSPHFGIAIPNSSTLLFGSTTASGSDTNGQAKVEAVNISNPSSLALGNSVTIPQASWATTITPQGNLALVTGFTTGWNNPGEPNFDPTGDLTLTALDITTPASPAVISTVVTNISTFQVLGAAALGGNQFAVAIAPPAANATGPGQIVFVDASNTASLAYTSAATVPGLAGIFLSGSTLYAATTAGLNVYQVTIPIISYTATVQIANTPPAAYNSSSFSVTPTSITPGTGYDTVVWTNPPSNTITWTSNVTGIQPGQVIPVDGGGSVNFTVTAGSGTITLPQVNVNSAQILGITPRTQTVAPGQLAPYMLTVNNPTAAPITYSLGVSGVNPAWVTLPSSVTVAANSSSTVPLNLSSAVADIAGTYNFTVNASSAGLSGSVQATMILTGSGTIGAVTSGNTLGVSVLLTPSTNTGGQGTPAVYTAQLTNAGSVSDTYSLSVSAPGGFAASFGSTSITVPPGLSNFRQTTLRITPPQGASPTPVNFTVTATSQANPQISGAATGTLNVASTGVSLSLNPPAVNPGGTFQLTVRNLGMATDTFTLALGGPAAAISRLPTSSIQLAAGQSENLAIAVGAAPFAVQGSLGLVVTATGGVTGSTTGTVNIPASKSVSAAFSPVRTGLAAPGPATLNLLVDNTGSVNDIYVASIISTSGPVTAQLVDVTGLPVTTTSPFAIPGAGTGELQVNANLTGTTDATVTVRITSQSDPSVTTTAIGTIGIGTEVPVAVAGKNRNAQTGKYTSLDGGLSYDPDENRLTYLWTMVSTPAGSALNSLTGATTPQPDFLPDVNGVYTFHLVVNNGSASSLPSTVQITAYTSSIPPNANAGKPLNAEAGVPVTLNGSGSDPNLNNTPLTYSWTVASAPAGSALAGRVIGTTASPSFTADVAGAFTLALQVSDTFGSASDTVVITAANPNVPPNAVAGNNRRILLNMPVMVDGSGSFDPDNGPAPLSYQWHFVSSPLADAALQNAQTSKVTFTPTTPGFNVVRLDLSDGTATSFDETTVMAANFCDANADGVINQIDFDLITALIGTTAQPGDPLDVNADGRITSADLQICQAQSGQPGLPSLYAAPPALAFQYVIGGALPAAQTMGLVAGVPNAAFTLFVDVPWIVVSPPGGSTGASGIGVGVTINPAGLAAGTYTGDIYAFASGFNSPSPVHVQLTVYNTPQFIFVPSSLSFTYQIGQPAPPPQSISVGASGANVNFSVAVSGASWLSASPSVGMTPQAVAVTATPTGLNPGSYTGTLTFTAPLASTQTVPVTLTVNPAPPSIAPSGIVNAASLLTGPVAPGEYLLLNGAGFTNSGQSLSPPGKNLPFQLANTQVFFDAFPAPLVSVSPMQIEAIVPFELAGHSNTVLKVVNFGVPSPDVTLNVAPAAVGVFTANNSGTGQISALNADSTANGPGNPAARGSTITFYLTGAGQTNPGGVDGQLIPPGPPPVLPVSIQIGGQPAQVTFASGAPSFAAGLIQVNAVIPQSIAPGVAVPVSVTVGTSTSQTGITLSIR
ncbi:MAG TPA: dockerin type I domain-containing protein [Bryobacteraceae bacterium]|nr:dockerin type I domain-containing protein [Bryobacteraceae bacterium]